MGVIHLLGTKNFFSLFVSLPFSCLYWFGMTADSGFI